MEQLPLRVQRITPNNLFSLHSCSKLLAKHTTKSVPQLKTVRVRSELPLVALLRAENSSSSVLREITVATYLYNCMIRDVYFGSKFGVIDCFLAE